MAWRDAKASRVRLVLFMASIVLGIAAVVSIQLFRDNLQDNIQQQSKSLMGADYLIDIDETPNERAQAIIDSLNPVATEVNFVSMIAFPKNGGTKLVRVRGLEGAFPIYGKMKTQPELASSTYQDDQGALVDATLMLQYNIEPGDSIKVGELTLPIIGSLNSLPGSSAVMSSVAPPVVIPFGLVPDTELLQFGSRKEYQYYYKADATTDLIQLEKVLEPMLDAEKADLDTHTSTSRRLGRRYENMGKFLNLVAFIALLLGCVGIASSVHIYIREKLKHIAVLKCLGASRRQSFLIYLIQIAGIGIIGGCIGGLIGIGIQESFPYILQEFLPFEVSISITAQPVIMGIVLGFLMAVLFALLSLLNTWYVSPLQALRISDTSNSNKPKVARFAVFGAIVLFLFLFSYWLLEHIPYAIAFVIGMLITFAILAGVATLIMKLIKLWFPKSLGYTTRQSLLNLYRPNNQTLVLIVAIGLGTFLISTLYFTKDILLAKTEVGSGAQSANIIMLDVQPEQGEAISNTIAGNDLEVIDNIPLVTMRIHSVKGMEANEVQQDTTIRMRRWVFNHEFRTTYRDSLIASEEILEGEWVSEVSAGEVVPISISDNVAEDAQVTIGDKIVFNVQGVLMETVVGSIRMVDWGQLQLNFSVVFPKGVLEKAPQFNVLTTNAPNEASSARLQQAVVKDFPNVTIIDLRQVYTIVEDILSKVTWIINFMAFFSILTGIIVLIGSVRTSKYQRIKESVLLRTLGAQNKQILKISALEYLLLGLVGSLVGIVLALISAMLLALFVFNEPFVPSVIPFVVFLPIISLLVLGIGLSNISGVLNSSPLEVLRREV
ncbi:ABC transporter permease [Winogradskyella ouciana]|uniref:FtsX-like permease family protein n=1 Tax=Winogradskyella ouciana TaxID=2608631 RepID=A0A7K1GBA0_9FLAO|nr:FtsX-like permease family protein [Winogradskyella ouciana]MTE25674.1 FtsX-like permease family protein [Winogradskyella ouciana]